MPHLNLQATLIFADWQNVLTIVLLSAGGVLAGLIAHRVAFGLMRRVYQHRPGHLLGTLLHFAEPPARFILPLLTLAATIPWLRVTPRTIAIVLHACELALIGC